MTKQTPTVDELVQGASSEALEAEVRRHNALYWDQAAPQISDYDYDRLVRRLQELSPDAAILQDLGPSAAGRLGDSVTHATPMLSLDKCYSDEDLESWAAKFEGPVMVTPKMDGIACSLRYDARGRLTLAATRGSGTEGDDITVNARTIEDIPHKIDQGDVEVRGEIYMRLSVFSRFAEQFSNPRNLAAGAIKHKEPGRCAAYGLSFAAYDLLGADVATEQAQFERLERYGFPPMEAQLVEHHRIREGYEHFATKRAALDFEIDGVVFKADRVDEQQRLGTTSHHPRWAMAYKFQGDSATTTLRAVGWSVARSGAVTPVAHIEPVELSGAEIRQASLHNAGFLEKLGLLGRPVGARVVVTRRGGVIPKVEFVAKHAEPGDGAELIGFPTACPSCDGPLEHEGDFIRCARPESCRMAVIGRLKHYCAVIDIQGFGDKLLAQCHDAGLLRSPVDLYTLNKDKLVGLERMGDRSAQNVMDQVAEHRTVELAMFLRALGLEELGKHVSAILAQRYQTLERVRQLTAEELAAIHTIGEIIADKVVRGLAREVELIDALLQHVTVVAPAAADAAGAPDGEEATLAGQSFVFTGKLEAFDRKRAQKRVKALGGAAPGGVTKGLTYLVLGDGSEKRESSKLKKARKLVAAGAAIKIISEGDFLGMVGEV